MRVLRSVGVDHDQLVERAEKKIADQKVLLSSIGADDPRRREAERLLYQMQQNLDLLRTNRSFSRFGAGGP